MRSSRLAAALMVVACLAARVLGQTGFVNWETPHVSPIALTPSGARLLAVNTADNRLEVFSVGGNGSVRRAMSIPVGLDPVSVRARTENEAWVVNHVSDSISIVDLLTGRVMKTVLTGDEPCDVIFAGSGASQRAFVSMSQLNQVWVYNATNIDTPTVIDIQGEEPRSMAVSLDGTRVFVSIFESGNATTAVRQQDVSNPTGPYGGQNPPPNSGNVFSPPIAAGLTTPPEVAQIVRKDAAGRWRDGNGRDWSQFVTWNMHDHDVAMINTTTLAVTYASGMMTTVMGIGVRPDGTATGRVTIVGTEAKNEVRFEPNVNGIIVRCEVASFSPATPTVTAVADLNPHLTYLSSNIPVTQRNLSIGDPRGIAWHPTNGRAYVSGMGSNSVVVTDTSGARFDQITVGQGPTGLVISGDGSRVYVLNKFDGSISTIDTGSNTEVSRASFFDPTPGAIRAGRPLMYDTHRTSGLGQVACASCHIDSRTDFLAWDIGSPAGAMKAVNQVCRQGQTCRPWNPMKGPMVTQTFQGITGNEPLHWRGDRENVAAFAPAYTGLQGADAEPSATEMQQLTDFVATIKYHGNPNRNIDDTMPTSVGTTGGNTGNPNTGLTLYQTLPVLGGNTSCLACHALPSGTSRQIDDPNLALAPQSMKQAQLRGLWEKIGWRRNFQNNAKGFGFNHHSEFDTLNALLLAGFNFGGPAVAQQRRQDVEAFMICFPSDTHPGVGQQVTLDGTNGGAMASRLSTFMSLANGGVVGLMVKGKRLGLDRGWYYVTNGGGFMQSDRANETISESTLRSSASTGNELTYTLVPTGTQRRIGVDRDSDGYLDRDERDSGADPANASSTPQNSCVADLDDGSATGTKDGGVGIEDLLYFLGVYDVGVVEADVDDGSGQGLADGGVGIEDFLYYLTRYDLGC